MSRCSCHFAGRGVLRPPALVIGVHGLNVATGIFGEIVWHESWNGLVIYIGWVLGIIAIVIVVHESVHALIGRWVGLQTKFTFEYSNPLNWSAQALTYSGFQSSRESLVISLAPLVVLTPVSIVVLMVSQHFWVIAVAALVTLVNAAGSVGDLVSACLLLHLPDGNSSITTALAAGNITLHCHMDSEPIQSN